MKLVKSLLLGSAATLAVVAGAQAADLPSKKAAPVNYVRICDAYGAGFFYIPGTDTCVKLGGYVRAEYQYVPAKDQYILGTATNLVSGTFIPGTGGPSGGGVLLSTASSSTGSNPVQTFYQPKALQSTTGYEVRGRIDVDARTPTAFGTARTYVRLRAANTSGIRNTAINNGFGYSDSIASTTGITIESAMVQWAGFTFGVAPENYAMMPSFMYNANPWAGFPNGMKQIAYTATFGGGFSATIALEDKQDFGYPTSVTDRVGTAANLVGNVRLDQAWGFAALHGMVGNNSAFTNTAAAVTGPVTTTPGSGLLFPSTSQTGVFDYQTKTGWAIGSTVSFKLPMLAAGDQVWFTANYTRGLLGAILSSGGMSNISSASNHRLLGGLVRVDTDLAVVNSGIAGVPNTVENVTGWNVAMAFTHYWAAQWRSNFTAGYVQFNPPTLGAGTNGIAWGRGTLWEVAGSIIYSPAKDFDIGLEVQYAQINNKLQVGTAAATVVNNTANAVAAAPWLKDSNFTTKLRVERTF